MFFFNPSTRCSVWEKPEELKNRTDVDKLISNTPDSPQQGIAISCSTSLFISGHNQIFHFHFTVDKKEEIKEVKSDKKKKSDSGTEEPPPKKIKSNDEGKFHLFAIRDFVINHYRL